MKLFVSDRPEKEGFFSGKITEKCLPVFRKRAVVAAVMALVVLMVVIGFVEM